MMVAAFQILLSCQYFLLIDCIYSLLAISRELISRSVYNIANMYLLVKQTIVILYIGPFQYAKLF